MRRTLVEALPGDLPETIDIDITNIKIGQSIRVKDVSIENTHFLNNSEDVIVAVKTARAAITEEEEEGTEEAGEGVSEGGSEGGDDKPAES